MSYFFSFPQSSGVVLLSPLGPNKPKYDVGVIIMVIVYQQSHANNIQLKKIMHAFVPIMLPSSISPCLTFNPIFLHVTCMSWMGLCQTIEIKEDCVDIYKCISVVPQFLISDFFVFLVKHIFFCFRDHTAEYRYTIVMLLY